MSRRPLSPVQITQFHREKRRFLNQAVQRLHDRLAKDSNEGRVVRQSQPEAADNKERLEALQKNDIEAYKQMLQNATGMNHEGYKEIADFIDRTDLYLNNLAARLRNARAQEQGREVFDRTKEEALARGFSEKMSNDMALEAMQRTTEEALELARARTAAGSAQSRYYLMAHAIEEPVKRQPNLLRPPAGAQLRDYQMTGLQWMISLYNNYLNGILADEMGLGKTIQVMSLVAYLMEKKANYGPHLIIAPKAVIVNWKAELLQWLPGIKCVFYYGDKHVRHPMFQREVMVRPRQGRRQSAPV